MVRPYSVRMMRLMLIRYLPLGLLACTGAVLWLFLLFPNDDTKSTTGRNVDSPIMNEVVHAPVLALPLEVKYRIPTQPTMLKNVWQVVVQNRIDQEIYLYSAYYDDRKTITHPTVRVISIIEKNEQKLYCILWMTAASEKPTLVQAVRNKAGPGYWIHGKKFQAEIFSCGVPDSKPAPDFVSIITDKSHQPTTYLSVDIADRLDKPLDLGVCITKPYGEISTLRVIEWMEALKMWGVGEITMYNNSLPNKTMDILSAYIQSNVVVLYPAPIVIDDDDTHNDDTQRVLEGVILNDCLYRNMYRYTAMICTDLSELIVPRAANDYFEMLTDVQRAHPSKHPATTYLFRNANFFLDLPPIDGPDFLMTQRHIYRASIDEFGLSGRSISSPKVCIVMNTQMCWKLVPKYDTKGWLIDIKRDIGLNQRWENCNLDELYNEPGLCDNKTSTIHKDESMLSFSELLSQRVTAVLLSQNMEDVIFGESLDSTNGGNSTETLADVKDEATMMKQLHRNTAKILKVMIKEQQGHKVEEVQRVKEELRKELMNDGVVKEPRDAVQVALKQMNNAARGKVPQQ